MQLFGLTITRAKRAPTGLQAVRTPSWFGRILESFPGAWQQNVEVDAATVLTYSAVYACVTLIAADVAKLRLRLMQQDQASGVWTETANPAFSPVLRKPNSYQTIVKFVEQWIVSKLIHGNTYVLKARDGRGVVAALYILDPTKVRPFVAPDGSVWYEIGADELSRVQDNTFVPAREIIHDPMVALFHPLVGVSPLTACGLAATQGLTIQQTSTKFFENGGSPRGILTSPGTIPQETADRLTAYWETNFSGDNVGKIAVMGDGLKFDAMAVNAVDAQLIEQLKWTGETCCTAYHVPPYMIGIGPPPPYANIEPLLQQYYSQCIQALTTSLETALDHGLGLLDVINGTQYGVEFDVDDLIWMDNNTKSTVAQRAIQAGMAPNEVRVRFWNAVPVAGGDSPLIQQQNYSLEALARRDASDNPFGTAGAQRAGVSDVDATTDKELRGMALYAELLKCYGSAA